MLLGRTHAIGQFELRHLSIIAFTIFVPFFLNEQDEALEKDVRQLLHQRIGERAEVNGGLVIRALCASVNSMLVVGCVDRFATAVADMIACVPHGAVWTSITGSFRFVPFLGCLAVTALTL